MLNHTILIFAKTVHILQCIFCLRTYNLHATINSKPNFIADGLFACQNAVEFDLEFICKIMQAKN